MPSKFFIAATIGLGFSLAVILSTIGLMDGFEKNLKISLREHRGDIQVKSRWGRPIKKEDIDRIQQVLHQSKIVGGLKTEGFVVTPKESRGVQLFYLDQSSQIVNEVQGKEGRARRATCRGLQSEP